MPRPCARCSIPRSAVRTVPVVAANDGSFEIHSAGAGTYEVNVVSSRRFSLRREVVHLDSFFNRFTIQLPKASRAVTLILLSRASEAESLIRRIVLRDREMPKCRLVLGMALAALGIKPEEARAVLAEVPEQMPSAKTLLNRMR